MRYAAVRWMHEYIGIAQCTTHKYWIIELIMGIAGKLINAQNIRIEWTGNVLVQPLQFCPLNTLHCCSHSLDDYRH